MEKVIRDGKVGVILASNGQWFTAHQIKEFVFLPEIVELVEKINSFSHGISFVQVQSLFNRFQKIIQDKYNLKIDCLDLIIKWIPVNSKFIIIQRFDWETDLYWEEVFILNDENILEA